MKNTDKLLEAPVYKYKVESEEFFGQEFGEEVVKAWKKAQEDYDESYDSVEFQMDPSTFEMIPLRKRKKE